MPVSSKTKRRQLELFASETPADIHSLGLLGWSDPLWTTRFTIELQDGTKVAMNLITIRTLQHMDVKLDRPLRPLTDLPSMLE